MLVSAAQNAAAAGSLGGVTLLIWIGIIVVFWLLFFLPQQRQQKKHQEMLKQLKRGDKVITTGGLHGVITDLRGDEVLLKVAEKTEVTVSRSAIASKR